MSLVQGAMKMAAEDAAAINWSWVGAFALALVTLALVFLWPTARKVVVGKDGRVSTSKFQAAMWTFVVIWALLALFYADLAARIADLVGCEGPEGLWDALGKGFDTFLSQGLDGTYMLLLGIPFAGAIASKAITTAKVASGSVVKPDKDDASTTNGVDELIGDDNGEVDLGDLQYLLFNLLAVAYFVVQFVSHPTAALPAMPDTLVALTGVAAAAYVGKKSVYREPPILLGVLPPSGKPGDEIRVYGSNLIAKTAKVAEGSGSQAIEDNKELGLVVTFNGVAAEVVGEATESKVTVKVPDLAAGPVKVAVLRPPGATSEEMPFTVLATG